MDTLRPVFMRVRSVRGYVWVRMSVKGWIKNNAWQNCNHFIPYIQVKNKKKVRTEKWKVIKISSNINLMNNVITKYLLKKVGA